MKKLLVPSLAVLLVISCKKHDLKQQLKFATKMPKGTSHTIAINANALPAHLAHGDLLGDCSEVTTTICDQIWMVRNLDVDHYRNGDPILKFRIRRSGAI
jgi:hypothetical protein